MSEGTVQHRSQHSPATAALEGISQEDVQTDGQQNSKFEGRSSQQQVGCAAVHCSGEHCEP